MEGWLIWLVAAAVFLIIEFLSLSVWAFCIAFGCVAGMVVSLAGGGLIAQFVVPVAVVAASWLLLMPYLKRRLERRLTERSRTGMDALLGRKAVVTDPIMPGEIGRGRIDGDSWQLRAPGADSPIERGTEVVVTGYDSIILDVAP